MRRICGKTPQLRLEFASSEHRRKTVESYRKPLPQWTRAILRFVVEFWENFLGQTFAFDQRSQAAKEVEFVVGDLLFGDAERGGGCFVWRAFDD